MIPTESILGYEISTLSVRATVDAAVCWVRNKRAKPKAMYCLNPHSIVEAENDVGFQEAIDGADVATPDGQGIVLASRVLDGQIKKRVTGSDLFWGISSELNRLDGARYFFLGSTEDCLAKIVSKMKTEYPNITVVGTYSPPYKATFTDSETAQMIQAINDAHPDVLWVGMTAPKQEKWIHENKDKLSVSVVAAIGAVFDFFVGNVQRSSPKMQAIGLEWLPRLLQEPRRLWKRTFVSAPKFLFRVVRQKYL